MQLYGNLQDICGCGGEAGHTDGGPPHVDGSFERAGVTGDAGKGIPGEGLDGCHAQGLYSGWTTGGKGRRVWGEAKLVGGEKWLLGTGMAGKGGFYGRLDIDPRRLWQA
jgi:hypothetical protein